MRERKLYALKDVRKMLLLAQSIYSISPSLSRLYVSYAFSIVKRTKVRLSKEEKKLFCRKCLYPWIEGKTLKREGNVYVCLVCGYKRKL